MVESMYARLTCGGVTQVLGFWGYGPAKELAAGGGLFVGQTGVSANHHFVLSVHHTGYEFVAGDYAIQVFAREAGRSAETLLSEFDITLRPEHEHALAQRLGVMFELEPDSQSYLGHTKERP